MKKKKKPKQKKWRSTAKLMFAYTTYEFTNGIVKFVGYVTDNCWIHDIEDDVWYTDDPDVWKFRKISGKRYANKVGGNRYDNR